jgi:hypothetical protein
VFVIIKIQGNIARLTGFLIWFICFILIWIQGQDIYIYIDREREREKKRERKTDREKGGERETEMKRERERERKIMKSRTMPGTTAST